MFQVGDILYKRYRLLEPLGKTAIGHQTWLADDLLSPIDLSIEKTKKMPWLKWYFRLNQIFQPKVYEQVTVKLLAFNPQLSWEQFKLFEREAQVLESLDHPFIPRYQNYFEISQEVGNGVPWFALVEDYIPGQSLQELLETGHRFTESQIRKIAIKVLNILIYLHELNPPVLHRDIKPSNLVLGEDENIYLIDFGAVQDENSVTNITFTVVGTSGYTPLEQFWGKAVPSSDLYALGATLIHLLTGISPTDLHNQDYQINFDNQGKIKPTFKQWLNTLTDIKISQRYQSAREALYRLKNPPTTKNKYSESKLSKSQREQLITKIKLSKKSDSIQLSIPSSYSTFLGTILTRKNILKKSNSKKIIPLMTFSGLFVVPFSLIITGITVKNADFIIASLEIMGGISFLTILGLLIVYLISRLGAETCLIFDKENLKINQKILGLNYSEDQEQKKNVVGVFIHQLLNQYKVSINTRQMIYMLGDKLTEDEALWLAKEIQNWLK
ncbi:MAG: serine/threonine protein kinase [Crocosphaera sp.]